MTTVEFSYEEYENIRAFLIKTIGERLTVEDKRFFLSFENGDPEWELFPIAVLRELPAIKWKLININKLKKNNPLKHNQMVENLKLVISY